MNVFDNNILLFQIDKFHNLRQIWQKRTNTKSANILYKYLSNSNTTIESNKDQVLNSIT